MGETFYEARMLSNLALNAERLALLPENTDQNEAASALQQCEQYAKDGLRLLEKKPAETSPENYSSQRANLGHRNGRSVYGGEIQREITSLYMACQ